MERAGLAAILVVVVGIASVPYAYARASAPTELTYTGLHYTNAQDTATYLYVVERARHGHLLNGNPYQGAVHAPFMVRPLYAVGGALGVATGLSNVDVFLLLRALTGVGLVLAIHALGRRLLDRPGERLAFVLVACFATGLGGVRPREPRDSLLASMELWMPEATTFGTLLESPHFILSLALMALVLAWTLDAAAGRSRALPLGGAVLLLAFEHPYDLVTLPCVLLPWLALCRAAKVDLPRSARIAVGTVCGVAAVGLGSQLVVMELTPVYRQWSQLTVLPSPRLGPALSGLGLLLPLAAHGAWVHRRDAARTALVALAGFAPVALIYSPVKFQRRLIEGASLALALLATRSLAALWARGLAGRAAAVLLALALLPTTVALVRRDLDELRWKTAPYYMPRAVEEDLRWIGANLPEDAVILCDPELGNFVPAWSGRNVWIGHEIQTPNYGNRDRQAREVLRGAPEVPIPHAVDWVVTGSFFENAPDGAALGSATSVAPVHTGRALRVYRVVR